MMLSRKRKNWVMKPIVLALTTAGLVYFGAQFLNQKPAVSKAVSAGPVSVSQVVETPAVPVMPATPAPVVAQLPEPPAVQAPPVLPKEIVHRAVRTVTAIAAVPKQETAVTAVEAKPTAAVAEMAKAPAGEAPATPEVTAGVSVADHAEPVTAPALAPVESAAALAPLAPPAPLVPAVALTPVAPAAVAELKPSPRPQPVKAEKSLETAIVEVFEQKAEPKKELPLIDVVKEVALPRPAPTPAPAPAPVVDVAKEVVLSRPPQAPVVELVKDEAVTRPPEAPVVVTPQAVMPAPAPLPPLAPVSAAPVSAAPAKNNASERLARIADEKALAPTPLGYSASGADRALQMVKRLEGADSRTAKGGVKLAEQKSPVAQVVAESAQTTATPRVDVIEKVVAKATPSVSARSLAELGVKLDVSIKPTGSSAGFVAVTLPNDLAASGARVSLPLHELLGVAEVTGSDVRVSTVTGAALPAWLRFEPETKTFEATALPVGSFPLQLRVSVGAVDTILILEQRKPQYSAVTN